MWDWGVAFKGAGSGFRAEGADLVRNDNGGKKEMVHGNHPISARRIGRPKPDLFLRGSIAVICLYALSTRPGDYN